MISWKKNYDRIIKINQILDDMLNKKQFKENTAILMSEFGLTYSQAKSWLNQEPNYFTTRRIFTEKKSDKDFTEPNLAILITYLCSFWGSGTSIGN